MCGSVGTGRRARLRILWWVHRVGSSPIFRSQIGNRNVSDLFYYLKGKTSLEINDAHAGRSDAGQYLSFLSAILHYDICRCFKGQKNCRSMISSLKWNRRGSNPWPPARQADAHPSWAMIASQLVPQVRLLTKRSIAPEKRQVKQNF